MDNKSADSGLGFTAMVGAAFAFSWGAVLVKAIGLPAPTTLFWRLAIASGALLLAVLLMRRRAEGSVREQVFIGVSFGLHQWAFVTASSTTSVAMVALMVGMQPLVVSLLGFRLTGEKFSWRLIGWALLALGGVSQLFFADTNNSSRSLLGDLLAFLNLLFYVAYFFAGKRARIAGATALGLTTAATLGAFVLALPAIAFSSPRVPANGAQWLLLGALALGAGNGHLLVNWAHSRITAGAASTVLSLVPFLAGLWAHWLFGEPFGAPHILGALCVAIAVEGARRTGLQLQEGRSAGSNVNQIPNN